MAGKITGLSSISSFVSTISTMLLSSLTLDQLGIVFAIILGLVGTALSVLNYFNQRNSLIPSLRIIPQCQIMIDRSPISSIDLPAESWNARVFTVRIENVGRVPVSISSLGFICKKPHPDLQLLDQPRILQGDWPEILPHKHALIRFDFDKLHSSVDLDIVKGFAVNSVVGNYFKCSRKYLKNFKRGFHNLSLEIQKEQ